MASPPGPLLSTQELQDRLGDPLLRVFDTTVHLERGSAGPSLRSGRGEYDRAHIPGAGFLDVARDLSDRTSDLAFTRPGRAQLEEALSRAGVSPDSHVVLYSASTPMWATRVWWLLRAAGHEAVSLLDGGLAKWRAEGRPLCAEPCSYPEGRFKADPREELWASRDEVLAASAAQGASCVINALPSALHRGEASLGYARAGRIRGSLNVPFPHLLDESGTLRPVAELRRHFEAVGALDRERVIHYCGGAISATVTAFALRLVGHPNVAVYDGSLDEWSRDPSLPMETGD